MVYCWKGVGIGKHLGLLLGLQRRIKDTVFETQMELHRINTLRKRGVIQTMLSGL